MQKEASELPVAFVINSHPVRLAFAGDRGEWLIIPRDDLATMLRALTGRAWTFSRASGAAHPPARIGFHSGG